MWCVIWKKEDSLYQIFTNLIFDSEKNALEKGLWYNVNKRKKKKISRSKAKSTISAKAYKTS